jgi:hypothetical protein
MNLPFGLQVKDVIGPIIAIIAAAFSWFWYWRNIRLAKRNANRSIYVDGQKFLIDVCKQLVSEPVLWCVYDDEPLRKEKIYDISDPIQQAKLRAFAHLHLNMFEIIVNEVPKPAVLGKRTASNVWYDYLGDTLTRSRMIREILEEPASKQIWSDALHKEYRRWKEKTPLKNVNAKHPADQK